MNYIIETAVYCGALKHWRILNLLSGTVYSHHFDSQGEALAAIKDGEDRNGKIVKRLPLASLCTLAHEYVAQS